ncbi:Do family serine endopeptidase [Devosia neptuniae]|jgi:Do/DeqQ family serine protease|uniref:Do family serine endopeptidase n=1 Tax=Devosia TaxID=46913 RepID=UPI0022B00D55|nr:Do family serine endopeptidase [Devosia neptuniae]MCZ4345346.1 Do family serine endopeptidase [Devosia neptuniae]|tara:strand:- start:32060 stop:33538 length:1479 start_codon:yes stop_codon:yes gene_type:complete
MSMRTLVMAGTAIAVLAIAGTLAFAPWNAPSIAQTTISQLSVAPPADVVRAVPTSDGAVKLSYAPVVKTVSPSVVNVYATRIEQQSVSPFANDPFFSRFFGQRQFQSRPRESQSLGSGVIVEAGGVILTNRHVIEGATDVRIALSDGREFAVDVVIEDAQTDLAVLRVQQAGGTEFPAITFANSDGLEVGDLVLAIGNPFGVGQTVTSGIVSALARTGVERSDYEFFIQTDAAINPGNSGGALVDMDGHLVGINTAIYSQSGGSVGIGFAIPANMARLVADAGVAGGEIVRPWFGAKMQAVNADIAASLGMAAPHGALITEVAPDGPAAQAGFASGDVILSVDGLAVDDPSAFNFRLATRPIGQTTELARLRNGTTTNVIFTIQAAPVADETMIAQIDGDSRFAGTSVRQLDPALAELKGLPYDATGVIITDIAAGSPAQAMGLRVDDVIISLNDMAMNTAQAFADTASKRVRTWQIILQRDGRVTRSIVSG